MKQIIKILEKLNSKQWENFEKQLEIVKIKRRTHEDLSWLDSVQDGIERNMQRRKHYVKTGEVLTYRAAGIV